MRRLAFALVVAVLAAACSSTAVSTPNPSPHPTPSPTPTFAPTGSPVETIGLLTENDVFGAPLGPGYTWGALPPSVQSGLEGMATEGQFARVAAKAIDNASGRAGAVVMVVASAPAHVIPPESFVSQVTGVPQDVIQITVIAGHPVLLANGTSNGQPQTVPSGVSTT